MSGYIDLHSHFVPGVDDGVRDTTEALALCRELSALGYARSVATPHIRRGMFDNRKPGLQQAFAALQREIAATEPSLRDALPELDVAAEHHFDSLFWELLEADGWMPYPGGRAILIEFAYAAFPPGVDQQLFRLGLKGFTPVLAHPERYKPLFKRTDAFETLRNGGVVAQLDVMSLTGHYGRPPRKAAERMLEEGVYGIACSDAHRPEDIREVGKAIALLIKRVGDEEADVLLRDNPARLLSGRPTL